MPAPNPADLDALGFLFAVLPGILAFLIIRQLCWRDRRIEPLEFVVYSLAYTLVIESIWQLLVSIGNWIPTPKTIGVTTTSIVFAVLSARLINTGRVYSALRWLRLSNESDWPTVWQSTFRGCRSEDGVWATIELTDGRRLLCAIREFPWDQSEGHISVQDADWLDDDDGSGSSCTIEAPGILLIRASDVSIIEFLPKENGEKDNEQTAFKSEGPSPLTSD